ncbi:MAG: putative S-layer protein [Asgard group archaeon]|nr:putative S-layer protein [Asgard group archaeon]
MSTYETLPFSVSIVESVPQEVLDCQTTGNPGNLEIKRIEFNNKGLQYGSFGEDDEWFPFEEIEVEIEVESDDYDIDDISLEWGIYSIDDGEWLIDLDEESDFNLKDGDEESVLITFKLDDDLDIDLDEFIDNSENYRFYVIANGVIDDDNAGADDGEDTCDYDYESASIIIESDFVILDNIDMPETLSCGETVTVTADVWNIGDRDQDEVSVEVSGRESVLKFGKIIDVGDIDAFDRQQISFTFIAPKDLDEKYYALVFEVYDEDDDIYENDFDDDLAKFTVPFKVEGGCGVSAENLLISASLESGAKAGQEMIIRATITNNGDELETVTINAAEFGAWAELISQDQSTLVLNEGQSKDVLFTFDIKKDVSGTQMFFIELVSGGDVTKQPVSVSVEKAGSFLGITGLAVGDNASLWGLGILNVILIIIIILIAVKIARRK